jgi:hypothetical protein
MIELIRLIRKSKVVLKEVAKIISADGMTTAIVVLGILHPWARARLSRNGFGTCLREKERAIHPRLEISENPTTPAIVPLLCRRRTTKATTLEANRQDSGTLAHALVSFRHRAPVSQKAAIVIQVSSSSIVTQATTKGVGLAGSMLQDFL